MHDPRVGSRESFIDHVSQLLGRIGALDRRDAVGGVDGVQEWS